MTDGLTSLVRETAQKRRATPQGERTPGRTDEVRNNAGGFVFKSDDKVRLERLLILGSAGNTYYIDARTQAKNALTFLTELIQRDEALVRETVRDVSVNGRALRQDMSLLTLAALLHFGQDKAATRAVFNDIVRTATHLYQVCQYIDDFGGWGTAKVKAVAGWFTGKTAEQLAYQAVKFRSRKV